MRDLDTNSRNKNKSFISQANRKANEQLLKGNKLLKQQQEDYEHRLEYVSDLYINDFFN